MAKKSASETKTLKDKCVGTIKSLDGGGFTCFDADGKQITCLPNQDTTSSCWITSKPLDHGALLPLIQAQNAVMAAIEALTGDRPLGYESGVKG